MVHAVVDGALDTIVLSLVHHNLTTFFPVMILVCPGGEQKFWNKFLKQL